MANNLTVLDSSGTVQTVATIEDAGGVHMPIHLAERSMPTLLYTGVVTAAGAGQALGSALSPLLLRGVRIKASSTNSARAFVGDATVSSVTGFELNAGDEVFLEVADLAAVYVDFIATSVDFVTWVGI